MRAEGVPSGSTQSLADLPERESRFRAFFDALPVAVYTTDAAGRITYYNEAAAELWGHRPELGKSEWSGSWKLYWPDGAPMPHDQCPMALALKEGRPISGGEAIAERPDGTRIPFAPYPSPIFDASGALLGAVNMLIDISARKRKEELQRARERDLQSLIDQTPFMMARCDRDLRYRFVSNSYAAMLGRRPEDIVGRSVVEIVGQEAFDILRPYIERALEGTRVEFQREVPFQGAGTRYVHVIETPERNESGQVIGWVGSILDASERNRAEQTQQRLASIVESSDEAIVSKDLDGTIVSWNPGAERVFGYSAEEAIGQPITIVIPPELQHQEPDILSRIRRGERIDHFETVRVRKDGLLIDVLLTVSPVKNADGRIIGASKIARDITDRKKEETRVVADLRAMTILRQIGSQCVSEGDKVQSCLDGIVDAAIALMGAQKGNIQLVDAQSGELVIAAQWGFERPFLQYFNSVRDDSACGTAMHPDQRVIVEDVLRSEMFVGKPALQVMLDAGVRSVVSVPLTSGSGKLLGILSTHFSEPHWPGANELNFLDLLVRQSADYLERRLAQAALTRRAEEQTALFEFTNALYRAESLTAVYDAALDAILRALHCSRASILRFDEDGVMRFVAWRGLSERYRGAVEGHVPWASDDPNPEPICISDIDQADLPDALKSIVQAEGIGALGFVPILTQGRLIGKFMTYFSNAHRYSRDEVDLALNLARQLGFAVERTQAEQARRAAERELRRFSKRLESEVETKTRELDRIWNVSEDLLGVSTFEGHFISINPAWTKLLGWGEEEILGMHVNELRHPDDAAHSLAGRAELAQGLATVRVENRFRHKDGSWRWLSWTMTAENGLIYVSGRHVTSEKETATALEHAQRQTAHLQKMEALGQLTGGVAHDFNNILMIVSGHAQSLRRRCTNPKDVRALEAIQMASSRGESLTRQLLAFSRKQPLNAAVVSPAEAIKSIRDVLSGSLIVNIELSVDVPEATWPVRVDRAELELAMVNLVVNARDAMPDGGRLSISAANVRLEPGDTQDGLAGEFVALAVTDTGSGIPDDVLARVFEPFFTTKGAEKGTGLGLSQVYGFARRSGGTVLIKTEVSRGTTVTVYLPRCQAEIDRPLAEEPEHGAASDGKTVLVVEDNEEVRAVTVSLLEQLGYATIAVESADAALDVLASSPAVSLVFSDVVLPGDTDGLLFGRIVKEHYPAMPVVLTTGYAKAFDAEPEFPVLRKPYQIAALGRVIRKALEISQTTSREVADRCTAAGP